MRVADLPAVDDVRQLAAEGELAGFRLSGIDRHVGPLEGLADGRGQRQHRAQTVVLHDVDIDAGADFTDLVRQARGDFLRLEVGDEDDLLAGRDAQARAHGVARAGNEVFGIGGLELGRILHVPGFSVSSVQAGTAEGIRPSSPRPWLVSSQM